MNAERYYPCVVGLTEVFLSVSAALYTTTPASSHSHGAVARLGAALRSLKSLHCREQHEEGHCELGALRSSTGEGEK